MLICINRFKYILKTYVNLLVFKKNSSVVVFFEKLEAGEPPTAFLILHFWWVIGGWIWSSGGHSRDCSCKYQSVQRYVNVSSMLYGVLKKLFFVLSSLLNIYVQVQASNGTNQNDHFVVLKWNFLPSQNFSWKVG